MNNVLLDTCVLVEILHKNQNVKQIITDIGWKNCYISDITVVELPAILCRLLYKQRKLQGSTD